MPLLLYSSGEWHPYTVREVSEPAGYQIEPISLDFVVDEFGTLYLTYDSVKKALDSGTPASAIQGKAGEAEGSGSGIVFSFSDPQTMVTIQKVAEDGTSLEGAVFRLEGERVVLNDKGLTTGQTTSEPLEITTDAEGKVELTGVLISSGTVIGADGEPKERTYTYTLTEVMAPKGYEALTEPIVFTLSQTNELVLSQGADVATIATEGERALLKVTNKLVKVEPTPEPEPEPEDTSDAKPTSGGKLDGTATSGTATTPTSGKTATVQAVTTGTSGNVAASRVQQSAAKVQTPQTSDPTLLGLPVSLAAAGITMILVGSRKRLHADGDEQKP